MIDQQKPQSKNEILSTRGELLEAGLAAAKLSLRDQVKTWEYYTDEKADVARNLMRVVKALVANLPTDHPFRSLSIGSSDEPQFKLLHALSDGGLWLYDKDPDALNVVGTDVERHMLNDVHLVAGDYLEDFRNNTSAQSTLRTKLGCVPFDLITLHHALYYGEPQLWPRFMVLLKSYVLSTPGAIHLAMMSSSTDQPYTTTWLYNRFAMKFIGVSNFQDLLLLPNQVNGITDDLHFSTQSSATQFRPREFKEMMAVVWMIMLYPHVHNFDPDQRTEITEFVLEEFWLPGRDLVQIQDYVTATKLR